MADVEDWWAPWETRQRVGGPEPLLAGIQEFDQSTAPLVRPVLSRLARRGQSPSHLFITCADSRLVPNLFTSSGPGDLFTVRNVGNLVARCTDGHAPDPSMAAAIDYALEALGVSAITVCGHSSCGAAARLLATGGAGDGHIDGWLRYGAVRVDMGWDADQLARASVVQQLDNLRTYPAVADRVAAGELRLLGLYFMIESAEVLVLDPDTGEFEPVSAQADAG